MTYAAKTGKIDRLNFPELVLAVLAGSRMCTTGATTAR